MTARTLDGWVGASLTLWTLAVCTACGEAPDASQLPLASGGSGATETAASPGGSESVGGSTGSTASGGAIPGISATGSGTSAGGTSTGGTSAGGTSAGGTSTGGTSAGGTSTGGTSTGGTSTGGTSAGGTNAGGNGGSPDAGPSLIGDVAFSTPSQTFRQEIEVGMATEISGAEIRYTTDGTLPSSSSALYAGTPVSISKTTQLRAQAFVGNGASGSVSTGIYIARTIDPTSDIPIMVVDGYGKGKPTDKEVYFDAAVMVWEPVDGVASMASLPTLAMRAGYHVRGQSSQSFPQTPYKLELWDNADQDLDYALLGMPADSDWALIPPYYDRTLLRNPFTFELGRDMGLEAPRSKFAEVYLNYVDQAIGDADYQGIYWITETIKNNKVRTNLKQLKEKDTQLPAISGGYIFKFDQAAAEEPILTCTGSDPISSGFGIGGGRPSGTGTCWTDLEVVDPDPLNAAQKDWITQYIQQFHDCLHLSPIGDYATYMDVPSFIDYLIISELTLDVDAYTRSAFYFKDRDQKLKAGPLWDYNFALGGVGAQNAVPQNNDTGWRYSGTRNVNNWYQKLTADPNFMAQVKTRYKSLRETLLSENSIEQRMNGLSEPLSRAVLRDFAKWPVSSIITSSTGFTGGPTVATWGGQLQVMRDFILARLSWIDANLP